MSTNTIGKQEKDLIKKLELLEKKYSRDLLYASNKNQIKKEIDQEILKLEKKDDLSEKEIKNEVKHFGDIKEKLIEVHKNYKPDKLYVASLEAPKIKLPEPKIKSSEQKIDEAPKKDSASTDAIRKSAELIKKVKTEIGRIIVGQDKVVDGLIRGLICNGHVLLEGVPGIAKTLTIRALGEVTGCSVKRVQFTVDLLPTDIIGITSYTPGKGFEIVKGPVFANFLIADEINRSPPKTQSALLEAMQEKQVTIGKTSFELPNPFFVMATKNPLENTGVYPLPEAQVDRFLFNIIMGYPTPDEERKVMETNATIKKFEDFKIKSVITPEDIIQMQELVKNIYIGEHIRSYIIAIVQKTRDKTFRFSDCIAFGSSPRASIALFIASKARALMEGRSYVIPEDVKDVSYDVLRHRIILSYKATIKGVNSEDIITAILDEVKV